MKTLTKIHFPIFFLFIALLHTSGCAVSYVADYDASVKEDIIRVAKQVDLFWGNLLDTTPAERPYDNFKDEYNRIETEVRGLVMANEIRPLNEETTKQAQIVLELWVEDKAIHKQDDGFSDFVAKRHRKQFNRIFIAMAKGEEAKNITSNSDSGGDKK